MSIDPLQKKYPSHSPYIYCVNSPIYLKDFDGKDVFVFDKDDNIVAVFRNTAKDIAIKVKTSFPELNKPIVVGNAGGLYSGHGSYQDAFVLGLSGSGSAKVAGGTLGVEIVIFTRGKDAGIPQLYEYAGGSLGYSAGSPVNMSVAALNLYKPYSSTEDIQDKRVRADDAEVNVANYEGPFYTTQTLNHNTIYGTETGNPHLWFWNKITWFGEGVTVGSVAFSSTATYYAHVGALSDHELVQKIDIDNAIQEKINKYNKENLVPMQPGTSGVGTRATKKLAESPVAASSKKNQTVPAKTTTTKKKKG